MQKEKERMEEKINKTILYRMLNSDLFHPKNDVHEVETCSATMN
jgi:hypothetical protein